MLLYRMYWPDVQSRSVAVEGLKGSHNIPSERRWVKREKRLVMPTSGGRHLLRGMVEFRGASVSSTPFRID